MTTPKDVLDIMLAKDYFSEWMGLEVLKIDYGYCQLKFQIKKEMLNGFGSVHGGIIFSAADSAFAFACNSHGTIAVALDVSITYTKPARQGDWLYIEAQELHVGKKTGLYEIKIINAAHELVALFKGTAYRTNVAVEVGFK